MKKITLIFALFAFATSFGQRVQQRVPSLDRAAAGQQIQANESSDQVQSLRTNEALFADYLQNAQR